MLSLLVGSRTYICAAVAGAAVAANYLGYISDGELKVISLLAGAGGMAAIRAAIGNLVLKANNGAK